MMDAFDPIPLVIAVTAFVWFCTYVSGVRLSDFRGRK